MKIKLAELRKIINEVAPASAEFASLPQTIRLTSVSDDKKRKTVWSGDRDKIFDILAGAGASEDVILAVMKGQKFIPDKSANFLVGKGALEPQDSGSDTVDLPGLSTAPAAARAPGSGRMSPERAKEYVMYYMRRFAREMVKTSPGIDAAMAAEAAPQFLDALKKYDPRAERLASQAGLSNEAITELVVDTILDLTTKGAVRAEKAAATAATAGGRSKETYKIYPGGKRWASPVVTRVKGKVYVGPRDSKFKPGEQAAVAPEGDKMRVKKSDSDHAQVWEPE
jgi:hypothetical protein